MDHGFTGAKEPWEMTDGNIFLLRELSRSHPVVVAEYLDSVTDLTYSDSFRHAPYLKENIFRSLKEIMENLGKKPFRRFVELLIEPSFRNTKNENRNCAIAAEELLIAMEKVYGEMIFGAIIENENSDYKSEFEEIKMKSKMGYGPPMGVMDFGGPPAGGPMGPGPGVSAAMFLKKA